MTETDQAAIEDALQPFGEMLAADGYQLQVQLDEGVARLQIVAGQDACEDCLVPRTVLEPIVTNALGEAGITCPIDLRYPMDIHHH